MIRRETRFPARMSVSLSVETRAALDAAAERYQIAAGVLARWAIESGLPAVRKRLQKRQRNADG